MNNFSVFEYLYRDASNYKVWGTLILQGTSKASDLEVLKSSFESGEFFIAEQLGIPPLYADQSYHRTGIFKEKKLPHAANHAGLRWARGESNPNSLGLPTPNWCTAQKQCANNFHIEITL